MKRLEYIIDGELGSDKLTGSIYMDSEFGDNDYSVSDEGRFYFFCGPEIEQQGNKHILSDSINIYDYLENLGEELGIDIMVGESENVDLEISMLICYVSIFYIIIIIIIASFS